jgi:hypothetical protein
MFQTKNPTDLGKFCEGLAMEDVGVFYGHFGMVYAPRKIW